MLRDMSRVAKNSLDNLHPQRSDEPSHNPSGISKEKARLRRLFEECVTLEDFKDAIRKHLDLITNAGKDKRLMLEAIKLLYDKVLGKEFHVSGNITEDIKIEIITTKEGEEK